MRAYENEFLISRGVNYLRWMVITAALIWALVMNMGCVQPDICTGRFEPSTSCTMNLFGIFWRMGVTAIWAMVLSGMTLAQKRFTYHPFIVAAGDALIALIFVWFYPCTPLIALTILPMISAGLLLGVSWGMAASCLMLVLFITSGAPFYQTLYGWLTMAGILVSGLIFGLIGEFVREKLESRIKKLVKKRRPPAPNVGEQIKVLDEIISRLHATLNYERVLNMALDLSAEAMANFSEGDPLLVASFYLFEDDMLVAGSTRRYTPADQRTTLSGLNGVLARTLSGGDPEMLENPAEDPELGRVVAIRACSSCYVYPLYRGLDQYGVILFAHPEPDFFTQVRQDVLGIICKQALTALQNAILYNQLEEEKQRIMEVQSEAQKKLARDLHDGPTQTIASIAMRVNYTRRLMEQDVNASKGELEKIEEMARRTTKEIRHMLFTLRPLVLESSGLIAALHSMADKMNELFDQNVIIEADPGIIEALEVSKQTVIFYISEEAVNNARKHAQAAHIWVRVHAAPEDSEVALLEIVDDGLGFDVEATTENYDNRGSLGMVNMRERTELVNGLLQLQSSPGQGTAIRLWIPITDQAADRLKHTKLT